MFIATSSHADYVGEVTGVEVTGGVVAIANGKAVTSDGGAGDGVDIRHSGGTVTVDGHQYDTTKTSGTVTDPLALIKAVTDALTSAAAAKLAASAGTFVTGAAEAGTLSTTQMTTDLTEAADDHYNGRVVIWTSGALQNQAADITDYSGATGLLTYAAVTEAPTAGDTFVIV